MYFMYKNIKLDRFLSGPIIARFIRLADKQVKLDYTTLKIVMLSNWAWTLVCLGFVFCLSIKNIIGMPKCHKHSRKNEYFVFLTPSLIFFCKCDAFILISGLIDSISWHPRTKLSLTRWSADWKSAIGLYEQAGRWPMHVLVNS